MANTTNLNLEKPLDTDQALISVINSNSDKIDAYAGSTNQALATLAYTGTVANLQTSLVSLANSISIGEFHNIKYTAGETLAPFSNSRLYGGTFKRTGSNYWSVTLEDPEGVPVYGTYRNGRWSWEPLALNSGGTWTPTIERATVSNVVGKYKKNDDLYICTISFDLSAVESGSPYILGNSLPGYSSATFTAIEGNWSSTGNEFGEIGNTSNNNVWFAKNGAVYGLTGSVGKTVRCILTYFA